MNAQRRLWVHSYPTNGDLSIPEVAWGGQDASRVKDLVVFGGFSTGKGGSLAFFGRGDWARAVTRGKVLREAPEPSDIKLTVLGRSTHSGSLWLKNADVFVASPLIAALSSSLNAKSKTEKFCIIRSFFTDFGMAAIFRWTSPSSALTGGYELIP
jgi:hypothetical protein